MALNLYGQRAKTTAQLPSTVIASHHSHLDYNCIQTLRRILTGQGQPCDPNGKTISLFIRAQLSAGHSPGLFTLTAPTELGKTLSLFAFAAEHCRLYQKRRIILILPFLSIISQNVKDYRQIIPELLEMHSNSNSDPSLWQLRHRWDAPCIVTTNIGFFEPLFSADPGRCRHLHQIANSVIVLDEAQSLPSHLLDAG